MKVEEKREKYKAYMKHLQNEKENQMKKHEALKINLDKIYTMQKELSIFLKLTKANYSNGLQFLDVLKDIDGQSGMKDIGKQLIGKFEEEEEVEEEGDDFDVRNEKQKEEKVELTLKDIRDILFRVNNRILNKNMKK